MLKIVTPATELPITLAEAKAHAIVDFCDDDAIIDAYIQGVASYLDGRTGILGYPLMAQGLQYTQSCLERLIRLPVPSGSAVTVTYYDDTNTIQTLPATDWEYSEDAMGAFIRIPSSVSLPDTFDRLDAVQVNFTAGYAQADVPAALKVAIYQLIAHWFEQRAAVNISDKNQSQSVPLTFNALIAPFRKVGV